MQRTAVNMSHDDIPHPVATHALVYLAPGDTGQGLGVDIIRAPESDEFDTDWLEWVPVAQSSDWSLAAAEKLLADRGYRREGEWVEYPEHFEAGIVQQ